MRGQDPPRIRFCGFSGAMRRKKLLPRSVFRTREHPQSSGGARGGKTRLESNYAVFQAQCAEQSFYRAPYFTAREHPQSSGGARGGKARLELDSAVFSGAMCRTKLLPRSVFRTREHPQSSRSAQGARPASNQIMRFFRRNAPNKAFTALRISPQGNIHRAAGVLEGARPASNWIMRFFRRKAPEKPPRSCWLRGGPAVTGMGDATRT